MRPADFSLLLLADWRVCLETPGVALQTLAWAWPAFRGRQAISWGSSLLFPCPAFPIIPGCFHRAEERSSANTRAALEGHSDFRGWTLGARGCHQVRKTRVCRGLCWALGVHIQKRRFFVFAFFFLSMPVTPLYINMWGPAQPQEIQPGFNQANKTA